jgi:hypothetical protein
MIWNSNELNKIIDARSLNGASLLLMISGFASVFISFVGLYGSVRKDKCFLSSYCIMIFLILVIEVSAISIFCSYQGEARDHLRDGLNQTIYKINNENDKAALQVMNSIQTVFKCCGCNGPNDYLNVTQIQTCQRSDSTPLNPVYYETGCYDAIIAYVNSHLPVIIGLGITLMVFQVFCLIISIKTCIAKRPEGYEDI